MWVLLPAAYLLLAVVLHSWVARARPAGNRVRQYLIVGAAAGLTLVCHVAENPDLGLTARVALILAYAFGCELYIFLFTFVTSSVSVALLVARTAGPAPAASQSLPPADMVLRRLEAMHAAGLLQKSADCYLLTAHSNRLVRLYRGLRAFFHPSAVA